MIAVDTNILIYAHRPEMPEHAAALRALQDLVDEGDSWVIPWPCVHEFLGVTTNPKVFDVPTPVVTALRAINDLHAKGGLILLSEGEDHLDRLRSLLREAGVAGPVVHDARIAAICLSHGVSELWTADRDFSRFPGLRVRNPLASRL